MLGAASVRGTEIVDAVRNALTEHQANPALLWLGLPEVAFAQDLESASRTACALSRLDLAVALREFGAGFSSLEHLRQVPVPCLVLAPSLVEEADGDDPAGTELVRAIVRVAHKLGRVTMASGVRSATQLALLRNLGCNLCLGPAFGPPIGVEGVGAALAERYV
jgi:EAL domain-containing protein (putative c-di-GMP-specific phosphodiesterase class I)